MQTHQQTDAYSSPWSPATLARKALWGTVWLTLFRPTPKFLKAWRLFLLRLFGARISGTPFVSQSCKIHMPWHLTLEDRACLGPHSEVYNLGHVTLRARCTVAQYVYLCAGTHDLSTPKLTLVTAPIEIGEDVFIGAKALILPRVRIGKGAVIGAGSVVTKDMPEWMICAGNPCKPIKQRAFEGRT